MASSFIEYKGKGFWVRDSLIEISLNFFVEAAESLKNRPNWFNDISGKYAAIIEGGFPGWKNLELDEILIDTSSKEQFNSMIDAAILKIDTIGTKIPINVINSYPRLGGGIYIRN